jgi:putative Mg2+ transporter-C (MgtC) family protein
MSDAEIAGRLLLSVLFGSLVGIERQWHHKNAGLKTNTLAAFGATTFALLAELGFGPNSSPTQVAAGVVTGIGFVGAGVIMRRGGSLQGINSAATLWATAAMGLAIGAGHYSLAWMAVTSILVVQVFWRWIAGWIDKRSQLIVPSSEYELTLEFLAPAEERVRSAWSSFVSHPGVEVLRYKETLSQETEQRLIAAWLMLSESQVRGLSALGRHFTDLEGVVRFEFAVSSAKGDNG